MFCPPHPLSLLAPIQLTANIIRVRHALSIDKGEFLSKLFIEGRTKYEDAKALAIKVRSLCKAKTRQSEELVARYAQKVSTGGNRGT